MPNTDKNLSGVTAGDAVETKVLQAFIDHIATTQTVQLYIDIHSYSQLIMTRK